MQHCTVGVTGFEPGTFTPFQNGDVVAVTPREQEPGLRSWPTQGPLMMIAADDFDIQLVVGGMEQRGWRLLGVNTPPAIHLTLDVMEDRDLQKFLDDLGDVCAMIRNGELVEEGLLSYGGVGAAEDAPKWLLSAVEIFEQKDAHG